MQRNKARERAFRLCSRSPGVDRLDQRLDGADGVDGVVVVIVSVSESRKSYEGD